MNCGKCRRRLRWDEHLENLHLGNRIWMACPSCWAEAEGRTYEPRLYPHGEPIPRKPGTDGDLPVCGLCRRALLMGEEPTSLRVPANENGVTPGVHDVCGECVSHWKPAVRERLVRDLGPAYAAMPLEAIAGDLLL